MFGSLYPKTEDCYISKARYKRVYEYMGHGFQRGMTYCRK